MRATGYHYAGERKGGRVPVAAVAFRLVRMWGRRFALLARFYRGKELPPEEMVLATGRERRMEIKGRRMCRGTGRKWQDPRQYVHKFKRDTAEWEWGW